MSRSNGSRCCSLWFAIALLFFSCSLRPSSLNYSVTVSNTLPRTMNIVIHLTGFRGQFLDLCGHSPSAVMRIEGFEAKADDGRHREWNVRTDTVRVDGVPVRVDAYRIRGPIPPSLSVSYQVSPGRKEGDAHLGFTGRCFGFLGKELGFVTGRDVFLLPERSESIRQVLVRFSLPPGWRPMVPWRPAAESWAVEGIRGSAAEPLAASTIGLGRFHERSFRAGSTRVRLAFFDPPQNAESATADGIQRAVEYLTRVFGRGNGREYLVLVAPETPEGYDISGGGWASGQGRTLIPLSTERLRGFSEEFMQGYLRYAPNRSEIHHPDEFWLVDALAALYSRRAVARAGYGKDESVARGLVGGYLTAITTPGVPRNLEQVYTDGRGGEADKAAREKIGPVILLELDRELRERGVSRGLDTIVASMFRDRAAHSLWSLLPQSGQSAWGSFRQRYVRGTTFVPVPDFFPLRPVQSSPPTGGSPVSHLTLAYTGNTDGYIENCGCKANQSGGIARRASILDSLRRADTELVIVDAGSAFARPDNYRTPNALAQAEQRFYLEMMDEMGYAAATVGQGELANGPAYFLEQSRTLRTPFVCANVGVAGSPLRPSSTQVKVRGRRITIIGVFEALQGGRSQLWLDKGMRDVAVGDPIAAVRAEIERTRQRTDLFVVMGTLSPLSIRRLLQENLPIGVVISTDDNVAMWGETPRSHRRTILQHEGSGFIGRTLVLYTPMAQYGLSVANLELDRGNRIIGAKLSDSWLPESVSDEDRMRRAINRFYDAVGASPAAQAGVVAPLATDPFWQHKRYVGAQACRACHEAEFAQWLTTPHASAYKTLLDKHRHFQPVCISCHVVGFGSEFGYHVGEPEDPLGNVQCEVCHGPGAAHVLSPSRTSIRREVPEAVCTSCHNQDHSDRFVYADRLPSVLHRARDQVASH